MLKFWFQSKFAWLILTVITVVLVLFWMFSWTSRLNQKPLFLEFSGFYILFSFQGSLLLPHRQLIYITTSSYLCQQLFLFYFSQLSFRSTAWISYHRQLSLSTIFSYIFKTFSQIRKPVIFDFPCICRPTSKHVRVRVYHFSINLSRDFHLFFRWHIPYRIIAHPREAFISAEDPTPTETNLLLLAT